MKENRYSVHIAEAINELLTEDGWHYSFDERLGLFRFTLNLKGRIKQISYIVDVRDGEYIVYASCPIGADEEDEEMMAEMAEFICRANYGLKMGCFELDYRDGEIRFRVHICCDGLTPTAGMIRKSIHCPAAMFRHYGYGIAEILFNGASGQDAVERCEKRTLSTLHDFPGELPAGDGEDMTEMLARLASRMGEEDETETDGDDEA